MAKAYAKSVAGTTEIFIELRDENYPGSQYRLKYDAATDWLEGTYFQAVEQETYAVYFTRLKK